MNLLVVGHTPFDRLVEQFDKWCFSSGRTGFAQIGSGKYIPAHIAHARIVPNEEFEKLILQAEFVVCHAGAGIVGEMIKYKKNFLIVPRAEEDIDPSFQNPQKGYAEMLGKTYGLPVCYDLKDFTKSADTSLSNPFEDKGVVISKSNVPKLIIDFLSRS